MHDHNGWYLNLGRWAGVRVRLHASFLFLAVALVYLATLQKEHLAGLQKLAPSQMDQVHLGWMALVTTLLLFCVVLLHELGHCMAAWRLGGRVTQISLFPLGGLTSALPEGEPQDEMRVAMAGPTANLLACLVLLPIVAWLDSELIRLFHVLRPPDVEKAFTWRYVLEMAFYLNWVLAIVNLLPAAPLDGGRILRAALAPSMGSTQATIVQARVGQFVALLLPLVAWGIGVFESRPYFWAPVAAVSIVLFFSAKHELERLNEPEQEEGGPFGYDFSQGYTSLEKRLAPPAPKRKNVVRRWFERRRLLREQRRIEIAAMEEARLDGILVKLSEVGMSGLSTEEREILRRVSERYRNRP